MAPEEPSLPAPPRLGAGQRQGHPLRSAGFPALIHPHSWNNKLAITFSLTPFSPFTNLEYYFILCSSQLVILI